MWTHPANLLNSPFVINAGQRHLQAIFAWFCFSSQNEKSSFTSEGLCSIISLALIFLPHSPDYFKSVKSVLTIHCHWSSFSILVCRHSFSFLENKRSCRTVILLKVYCRMTSDPGVLHSVSAYCWQCHHKDPPVSKTLALPWMAKHIIKQTRIVSVGIQDLLVTSLSETMGTYSSWSFANNIHWRTFDEVDGENIDQNREEPVSDIWPLLLARFLKQVRNWTKE